MKAARVDGVPSPFCARKGDQFTSNLLHDEGPSGAARFHRPDIWHVVQMGIGKTWVACSLHIAQANGFVPGRSLDARLQVLTNDYLSWCRDNRKVKYIRRIDKQLIGPGGKEEPVGNWNKASLTVNLLEFLEYLSADKYKDEFEADERLRIIAPSFKFVTTCFVFALGAISMLKQNGMLHLGLCLCGALSYFTV